MPNSPDKQQFNLSIPNKTRDQLEVLTKKELKHCPTCGAELDEPLIAGKYKGQKASALAAKILEKVVQRIVDGEFL